jgi:hypothetical protein
MVWLERVVKMDQLRRKLRVEIDAVPIDAKDAEKRMKDIRDLWDLACSEHRMVGRIWRYELSSAFPNEDPNSIRVRHNFKVVVVSKEKEESNCLLCQAFGWKWVNV